MIYLELNTLDSIPLDMFDLTLRVTVFGRILRITVLVITVLMLSTPLFGAETPRKQTSRTSDSLPQSNWYSALTQVKSVPTNIWERMKLADQWVWEEYPDQVLIQEENRIKWPRYLSAALNTPEWLDVAFANRVRREGFDYPFTADQKGSTWDWGQRTRFRTTAKWKQFRAEFELQGANSGEDSDTDVVGSSTFNAANIQQLFTSMTLPNVLNSGLRTDFHLGRINLDIGSRRLVARSRFSNTSQAFDGIHWRVAKTKEWFFRAFFTQAVFNENDSDRVALFTNKDNLFWGLSAEHRKFPWARGQLYYYGVDSKSKGDRPSRKHSTIGLRVYDPPRSGQFDFDTESVIQFGEFEGRDHLAHFHHISFGYTFPYLWSPRILTMYDYASGTNNPNGNKSHTFDGLFGARRFELSATSLFGPFFRSNISSPGIRLIMHPLPTLKLNLKYRAWYLAQSRDEWTNSGIQDPTGDAGKFLGQDLEVRLQWHPSPNYTIDAGYERFFKGSYIKNQTNVPGNPSSNDTNYFYIQTELMF
jgi:hypothetical protein